MRNILITGSSGFIAQAFLDRFPDRFGSVTAVSRKPGRSSQKKFIQRQADLLDYQALVDASKGIDCIIHTAYDRTSINANIDGLRNLLKAAETNHVKRFVYLSSFVVYDPFIRGKLDEHSPYSRHPDHYCRTKQTTEYMLMNASKKSGIEIVILQPTVVYGLIGNWTGHAVKSIASGKLYLPEGGNTVCNAVHVADVANAMHLSATSSVSFNEGSVHKFLISAETSTTWKNFYEKHALLVGRPFTIEPLETKFKYGNSFTSDFAYRALMTRIGYLALKNGSFVLKKMVSDSTHKHALNEIIEMGRNIQYFAPKGMNRIYHDSHFHVDIGSARAILNYQPVETIDNFAEEISSYRAHS